MKSRFGQNILHLASGSVASQVVVLAAVPLLTRLYAPEEFGALALFTSAYGIAIGLVTFKYDNAIILPQDEIVAIRLTVLTCMISAVLSLVSLLVILGSWLVHDRHIPAYFGLLPIGTLLGAGYTCQQQWSARRNDYRKFSRSRLVGSLVNVGFGIGLSVAAPLGSLVIAWLAGLTASLAYVSLAIARPNVVRSLWHAGTAELVKTASTFKQFPLYQVPSYLILSIGQNATPFLLQAMFSLHDVGQYAVANRLLLAPSALIGGAVGEAFRAEFVTRLRQDQPTGPFFKKTFQRLIYIGLPMFGIIALSAPFIFTRLLGEEYGQASIFARSLGAAIFAQFVSQTFSYVFVGTGHHRQGLLLQALVTMLPLLALAYVGRHDDLNAGILAYSLVTFVATAGLIVFAYGCVVKSDRRLSESERNV